MVSIRWAITVTMAILSAISGGAWRGEMQNPRQIGDTAVMTPTVRVPDRFMSPPVIRLGTDDRLEVNFDLLGETSEYLRCRLVHCNADWTPSGFTTGEYTDGFNETQVTDYALSSNTFVHYVNYNLEMPASGMQPLVSGNYLLEVYREDSPDDVILKTGFYVTENMASVASSVSSATDKGFNDRHQQLELSVDLGETGVANPYDDLRIVVIQNNRPETARVIRHPQRVEGSRIVYSHVPELIFPAGNEYRRFETVRGDYPGMHVDSVGIIDGVRHAWLGEDSPRVDVPYVFDLTQRGRFMVDEYNASDPDLGADYITVHFTLVADEMPGRDIYVDGDFTLNRQTSQNRMSYDRNRMAYVAEIPLKQGSYNYQYLVRTHDGEVSSSLIEGDKYETINEYLILVYHVPPGSRGDRLIAATVAEVRR